MRHYNQQDREILMWKPITEASLEKLDPVTLAHLKQEWARIVRLERRGAVIDASFRKDFLRFYEVVGDPPIWSAQIKRIDVKGDYVAGNLRWAIPGKKFRKPYTKRVKPSGA